MNKKAALYVRVSTLHQIDKDSLPFQREELKNYAKYALGIEDFEIFEDAGYSGKNTDRPMYQKMMQQLRNGEFTHLLVWKIDRISRNLKDFTEMYEELKSLGVTFVSKNEQFDTSTAMGEAMLKIILVFAELERELAAERVYGIMLSRAEKGLWNGARVPIGYVWSEEEKYPVVDEEESKVVRYIYDLYEKVLSTNEVAFRLNEEGVPTKRGGMWTAKTVRDILRNPFYIGTYRYNLRVSGGFTHYKDESEWIVKENNHPGIIEKEQFDRVNNRLDKNYKGDGGVMRRNVNTHLFSRLMYCQDCGELLVSGLDNARKDGYRPSRYTCSTGRKVRNTSRCSSFTSDINAAPFIFNYIGNLLRLQERYKSTMSKRDIERTLLRGAPFIDVVGLSESSLQGTISFFRSGYKDAHFGHSEDGSDNVHSFEKEKLERRKQKLLVAMDRLNDLYLFDDAGISKKDFVVRMRELESEIEEVESELEFNESSFASAPMESFISDASYFLITQELTNSLNIDYRELLDTAGVELLSEFISSVIDRIEISDKLVRSITFANGVTHEFVWKSVKKQKNRVGKRGAYKEFFGDVLNYVRENGSINRPEVEKLTNLKRSSASSLLLDLENQGILERRGQSVAIRYFIVNDKKE